MGPFDHTIDVSLYYPCGAHEMSPLQSIKTIGDENMEQRKFKVGDRVRLKDFMFSCYNGKIGTVLEDDASDYRNYSVLVDGCVLPYWVDKSEMELVEEEKKMKLVFELEMGKHVVETKRGDFYLLVKQDGEKTLGLRLNDQTAWADFALDENLCDVEDSDFDIEKVYEYDFCGFSEIRHTLSDPVWQRNDVKEMTVEEICKALGYNVKIKKEDK